MAARVRSIEELARTLGYEFARPELLERAVTHASAALASGDSYQRLEFLGDRVLGLVIADWLMHRFPDETEGELARRLARLGDRNSLAAAAAELSLVDWIRVSPGEQAVGVADRVSVLSDAMEAIIGAVYRDGGIDAARQLIERLWSPLIDRQPSPPKDSKSALQEWTQARKLPLPHYRLVSRAGPDHAPVFIVEVAIEGFPPVTADGGTKRAAERAAAKAMLKTLDEVDG